MAITNDVRVRRPTMDHRAARRERRDPAMSFSAGCFRVGVCFSFVLQAELFISVFYVVIERVTYYYGIR